MNKGRIVKIISNQYTIEYENRLIEAKARGKMRKGMVPVVGDWVEFEAVEDVFRIHKVCPRKNRLLRPAIANVDQALIVTSMKDPDYSSHLLNRLIILVSLAGVEPIICITKSDLVNIEDYSNELLWYKKAGYKMVYTHPGSNDDALKEVLEGQCLMWSVWSRKEFLVESLRSEFFPSDPSYFQSFRTRKTHDSSLSITSCCPWFGCGYTRFFQLGFHTFEFGSLR